MWNCFFPVMSRSLFHVHSRTTFLPRMNAIHSSLPSIQCMFGICVGVTLLQRTNILFQWQLTQDSVDALLVSFRRISHQYRHPLALLAGSVIFKVSSQQTSSGIFHIAPTRTAGSLNWSLRWVCIKFISLFFSISLFSSFFPAPFSLSSI